MIRYGRVAVIAHFPVLTIYCATVFMRSFYLLISANFLLAFLFLFIFASLFVASTKYFTTFLCLSYFLSLRLTCRSKFHSKVNPSRCYAKIIELVSPTRNLSGGLPNLPSAHNSLSILRNPFMPVIMRGFAPYPYT